MRWLRSMPTRLLPHRAYVNDSMDRFYNKDYNYAGLADYDDDILLLEWDIAASREDKERFTFHASLQPERVIVAPHYLYHVALNPVLAHRTVLPDGSERWSTPADLYADLFAFGMIYLPRSLIAAFLEAPAASRGRSPFLPPENPYEDTRLCDQTFSMWHYKNGQRAVIDWSVAPVHLHE